MKRILLIEDEKEIRFLLKQYFKRVGLEVLEAGTINEAEALIPQLDDEILVLLDLNLPDGNGLSILKQINQLTIQCPVVICSANSGKAELAKSMGAVDFIEKPIRYQKLDQLSHFWKAS